MAEHVLFTEEVSNVLTQPEGPRDEAREVPSVRCYYHLTRSYTVAGFAGRRVFPESLSSEMLHTTAKPVEGLSRPPRLLAAPPLAEGAEPLHMAVPVCPTGVSLMRPALSPNKGPSRPVAVCAPSSFRTATMSEAALVFESTMAEGMSKPAPRPPAPNSRVQPAEETTTSPFRVNRVCAGQLPRYRQMVLPARRLQSRHVSKIKTLPTFKEADVSVTLWSEAASQADVFAFFGSQDGSVDLAASSPLRAHNKAPVSKELSWTVVDAAYSSLCDLSFSENIFSAGETATGGSPGSGILRGHVIDPQAVLSFRRDGARRQREAPRASSNAVLQ
ncbi:hypothetical protein, conserved [Leishmania lindenbergi]|uniref:Uncharacterized protein n=1 Tax=Leishmania lindenbergi TaxID=651832 RepID=A0AAW3AE09_9TRYP